MKRGAPASASAISSWRCCPWASSATRCCFHGGQMDGLHQRVGGMHQRVVHARAKRGEAPARDTAAGEIDIVLNRQAGEQRGNLVGAAQAAADPLIGREMGDVFAEEADRAGRGREVAGDAVEQRGLAGAVRAEDCAPFTWPHRDGDIGQRRERAEQPRHAAQLQRGAGADRKQALRDAIHGFRPDGLGQSHCAGAIAPTVRPRRRTTRTRWRGSRARSKAGSDCRRART